MKTPFGFANSNLIIGFLLSWGLWEVMSRTIFPWGWITVNDGFAITVIFTVSSYARTYLLNKWQHYLLNRKPLKVLILGHARHGKDCFAEMLGISFNSSSKEALSIFLFDRLNAFQLSKGFRAYKNKAEAFEDRVNYRALWHKEIAAYNTPDKTKLARGILSRNNCYVGMRSNEEYQACVAAGLFDAVYWIDASQRKPPESTKSFNISFDPKTMILVDNNKSLTALKYKAFITRCVLLCATFFNYTVGKQNDKHTFNT